MNAQADRSQLNGSHQPLAEPPFPLAQVDRERLELERHLSPEVIEARGHCTLPPGAVGSRWLQEHGFSEQQAAAGGGLLTPILDRHGAIVDYLFEPRHPRRGADGRVVTCESAIGRQRHVDFGLFSRNALTSRLAAVWTQGVHNADAAASQGMAAVNLNGIYHDQRWHEAGGLEALLGLEELCVVAGARHSEEQIHFIVLDSDWREGDAVSQALLQLGAALETIFKARGGHGLVLVVGLPNDPAGQRVGLSEYLSGGGCDGEMFVGGHRDLTFPSMEQRQQPMYEAIWQRLLSEAGVEWAERR